MIFPMSACATVVWCLQLIYYCCVLLVILFADLQMVNIGLRVLARPDQSQLPAIYRQLGKDYDERVLPSIINEVFD